MVKRTYGSAFSVARARFARPRIDRAPFPRAYGAPRAGVRRQVIPRPWRFGGFRGVGQRSPQERKVIDVAQATYGLNTTGSVTALNLVATGTDYTNRIGRKVNITAVQMRGFAALADATAGPTLTRIMLVWDMQPNGALALVTDVLNAALPDSFMNLNNRDRFRVLYDKQFVFGATTNVATQAYAQAPSVMNLNVYKRCNQPVTFSGTTAAIGSMETGALLLVTVGDQTAASTAGANAYLTFRMRFTDA